MSSSTDNQYDSKYGFTIETINAYGEGTSINVKNCPRCGENLEKP